MKKTLLLSTLSLMSFSSLAVLNGTPLDWAQEDGTVLIDNNNPNYYKYCTGTLIAGTQVLTAAHCGEVTEGIDQIDTVHFSNNSQMTLLPANITLNPSYENLGDTSRGHDIALYSLPQQADYYTIRFFKDLRRDVLVHNQTMTISGFGGTPKDLNRANFTQTDLSDCPECSPSPNYQINANVTTASHTTGGDSGSAWINSNNEIIAIHKGSKPYTTGRRETYGTNLHYASDWLLEQVNNWHYPTLFDTKGKATITIQSLHHPISGRVSDMAWGENVTLIREESTCVSMSDSDNIEPYSKCTYVIESDGSEGKLHLTNTAFITINKPIPATPLEPSIPGVSPPMGGDSGGSLGMISIVALIGFGIRRHKNTYANA
ncbi:GlyGly-CTERM sorting domain-containing protein [Vibrio sinensis]|uniref:Serine protease n=1 Tax=Vibrio sinensis TaxID=2302434 RepID=A0A3A6Q9V9_9VIBR|nr:trypsin-like serine protease [Vibrio sinensis]RJX68657.1 GlyGly-CTERM sorting domain-containing protein [Vibrio sinensis]